MRYMLLVYLDEQALDETEREECYVESVQLTHELNSSGHYLDAAPLHPTSTATSVRVREGKRLVTDGPFAESREQFAGYVSVECATDERAAEIAARWPDVRFGGAIEIRAILADSGAEA